MTWVYTCLSGSALSPWVYKQKGNYRLYDNSVLVFEEVPYHFPQQLHHFTFSHHVSFFFNYSSQSGLFCIINSFRLTAQYFLTLCSYSCEVPLKSFQLLCLTLNLFISESPLVIFLCQQFPLALKFKLCI